MSNPALLRHRSATFIVTAYRGRFFREKAPRRALSHADRRTQPPSSIQQLRLCISRSCGSYHVSCSAAETVPHYADLQLDRAGHIRKDSDKLQQLLESSSARLVVLHRHSGLLRPLETASTGGHGPKWEPALLPASAVPESCRDTRVGTIFLGLDDDGSGVFAVSLTEEGAQDVANEHAGQQVEWVELRRDGGPGLAGPDAALMAYAAGLVYWAKGNLFSSTTGRPLQPRSGGHSRFAPEERPVFTRIDPAVIMAITCGDWILLGRQERWSPGRYSLLAGFCEVGETLEQAVARETLEEAGVEVAPSSVRYHSSQPWPFPRSLMIGFTAETSSSYPMGSLEGKAVEAAAAQGITQAEIEQTIGSCPEPPKPDEKELEAAFWFHRSFLAAALQGKMPEGTLFAIPGPHALANGVISQWAAAAGSDAGTWSGQRVPDAEIDIGRFKYVLLRLSCPSTGASKLIVRGNRSAGYHADVYEATRDEMSAVGLKVEVLGGGRIDNDGKHIKVFGFSTAFGPAPHEISAALIRRAYPMADITTSYDGY